MPPTHRTEWTEADFDQLSWHDNHIHGIQLVEGEHGAGELALDIDFILAWNTTPTGVEFLIAPTDLVFRGVSNLRLELDYGSMSAAMGPFSIQGIERHAEERQRYTAQVWTLEISFPVGRLQFEATGFKQTLRGPGRRCGQQVLSKRERR